MVTRECLGPIRKTATSVLHGRFSLVLTLSASGLVGKQTSGQPTLHGREGEKGVSHVAQPIGPPWEMWEGQGVRGAAGTFSAQKELPSLFYTETPGSAHPLASPTQTRRPLESMASPTLSCCSDEDAEAPRGGRLTQSSGRAEMKLSTHSLPAPHLSLEIPTRQTAKPMGFTSVSQSWYLVFSKGLLMFLDR